MPRGPLAAGGPHPLPLRRARRSRRGGDRARCVMWTGRWWRGAKTSCGRSPIASKAATIRSMHWRNVQVVEPPAVEPVSVRLIPPPYTGWPPDGVPAAHPGAGGHPRRNHRPGHQAAPVGRPVRRRRRRKSPRNSATTACDVHRRVSGREIRLVLVRADRSRRPQRRQRRPLGNPRRPRLAADGEHRAADGQSLRYAGSRGADAGGGQGRPCRSRHRVGVPPGRIGAGSCTLPLWSSRRRPSTRRQLADGPRPNSPERGPAKRIAARSTTSGTLAR